jgi:hypothetical protein
VEQPFWGIKLATYRCVSCGMRIQATLQEGWVNTCCLAGCLRRSTSCSVTTMSTAASAPPDARSMACSSAARHARDSPLHCTCFTASVWSQAITHGSACALTRAQQHAEEPRRKLQQMAAELQYEGADEPDLVYEDEGFGTWGPGSKPGSGDENGNEAVEEPAQRPVTLGRSGLSYLHPHWPWHRACWGLTADATAQSP